MKKALLILTACSCFSLLSSVCAADVQVRQPWAKGTLDSARSTTVYMELFSEEEALIVAARSPLAKSVEMRAMRFELDGGPLRPASIGSITLPARKRVQLSPVTEHFVLLGLQQAVKQGDKLPLTLTLRMKDGSSRELQVEALARGL